jgi:hypothetical protein
MPTLYVNDVIQFRPAYGAARIVTVTSLGPEGFAGVLTANKVEKAVGRYDQILRTMKRADPDVDHRTQTAEVGEDSVTWVCACGHREVADTMREARTQQGRHRKNVRSEDDD